MLVVGIRGWHVTQGSVEDFKQKYEKIDRKNKIVVFKFGKVKLQKIVNYLHETWLTFISQNINPKSLNCPNLILFLVGIHSWWNV
jgi:hypothetical protein